MVALGDQLLQGADQERVIRDGRRLGAAEVERRPAQPEHVVLRDVVAAQQVVVLEPDTLDAVALGEVLRGKRGRQRQEEAVRRDVGVVDVDIGERAHDVVEQIADFGIPDGRKGNTQRTWRHTNRNCLCHF